MSSLGHERAVERQLTRIADALEKIEERSAQEATEAEEHVEPANDFWHGYERSPEVNAKLKHAIDRALFHNPTMRFGQLFYMLADHLRYWNVYDEQIIYLLELTTSEEGWARLRTMRNEFPYRRPEVWEPTP